MVTCARDSTGEPGGYGYIDLLWVRDDQRSCGLGTKLLAAAETEIRRRGCDRVALSTHSFQAPGFYGRFGYTECGGVQPVSIAVTRSGLVYVANSGAGGSGYSGFRLHLNGSLTAIPGTTVTVPGDAGLGDVFFNATGDHLIGTRTGTSQIDSFVVLPGGHLLAAKGSPFTGPRPARRGVLARQSRTAVCQ